MKLRELYYILNYKLLRRTPRPRSYPFEVRDQVVHGEQLQYAQWQHPKAYPCEISEQSIARHRQFLHEGDVAIDIGAHSGDSTLPIALATGATGCVLAFEANAYVFATLKKNSELNPRHTNIVPYNLAVTEDNRTYQFSYGDPGFMNGGDANRSGAVDHTSVFKQTVRGVNLDDFLHDRHSDLLPRIRFIKVDTEGHDLQIVRSIETLIDRLQPYLQVEFMAGTSEEYQRDLFDFFASRGYQLSDMHGADDPIESADEIVGRSTWDMLCTPPTAIPQELRRAA